ncbi:MAG: MATE family efflux transporter [Actinomycetia bacterium]|nr:MATE family efflux transporter [Actinomycetes bacterium]
MSKKNDVKSARLIEGSVGKILFTLTIPMFFGIISIVAFNLVDTYFVSKLGLNELAAISFTFPVIMMVNNLALGLGIGVSAVVSRAIGEGNHHKVQELTTDSLLFTLLLAVVFTIAGILTIDPLFRLLGADSEILKLIKEYMYIWYLGIVFVFIPMVGNNAIRAQGDTITPSAIMLISVFFNLILDPLLIFGIGIFPRMELTGAAIATVIARAASLFLYLFVVLFKYKMITFELPTLSRVFSSWKYVLFIGLPSAGTRIILPISTGVVTRIISSYGPEAVAAFGVGTRIEFFTLAAVMALASVLGPFVGQNWGAGKLDRVKLGIKKSVKFSNIWGLAAFIILALAAKPIALLFSTDLKVVSSTVLYLRIVPLGFGLAGALLLATIALNVLHRPLHAALLSIIQMFALYVPLVFAGSFLYGIPGIFGGITIAYILSGIISYMVLKNILKKESLKTTGIEAAR